MEAIKACSWWWALVLWLFSKVSQFTVCKSRCKDRTTPSSKVPDRHHREVRVAAPTQTTQMMTAMLTTTSAPGNVEEQPQTMHLRLTIWPPSPAPISKTISMHCWCFNSQRCSRLIKTRSPPCKEFAPIAGSQGTNLASHPVELVSFLFITICHNYLTFKVATLLIDQHLNACLSGLISLDTISRKLVSHISNPISVPSQRPRAGAIHDDKVNVTRILLTGGPCAGKTTALAAIS